ncbi:hypothetical protein SNEBB_009707 [Seison nebaliae]|nr:hypothetical protein SNEBB_009707 [Seison nebaliae]
MNLELKTVSERIPALGKNESLNNISSAIYSLCKEQEIDEATRLIIIKSYEREFYGNRIILDITQILKDCIKQKFYKIFFHVYTQYGPSRLKLKDIIAIIKEIINEDDPIILEYLIPNFYEKVFNKNSRILPYCAERSAVTCFEQFIEYFKRYFQNSQTRDNTIFYNNEVMNAIGNLPIDLEAKFYSLINRNFGKNFSIHNEPDDVNGSSYYPDILNVEVQKEILKNIRQSSKEDFYLFYFCQKDKIKKWIFYDLVELVGEYLKKLNSFREHFPLEKEILYNFPELQSFKMVEILISNNIPMITPTTNMFEEYCKLNKFPLSNWREVFNKNYDERKIYNLFTKPNKETKLTAIHHLILHNKINDLTNEEIEKFIFNKKFSHNSILTSENTQIFTSNANTKVIPKRTSFLSLLIVSGMTQFLRRLLSIREIGNYPNTLTSNFFTSGSPIELTATPELKDILLKLTTIAEESIQNLKMTKKKIKNYMFLIKNLLLSKSTNTAIKLLNKLYDGKNKNEKDKIFNYLYEEDDYLLHYVVSLEDYNFLKILMKKNNFVIREKLKDLLKLHNYHNCTALHIAIRQGNSKILKYFLQYFDDNDYLTFLCGSPLAYAISYQQLEIIDMLVTQNHYFINNRSTAWSTFIKLALNTSNETILQYFFSRSPSTPTLDNSCYELILNDRNKLENFINVINKKNMDNISPINQLPILLKKFIHDNYQKEDVLVRLLQEFKSDKYHKREHADILKDYEHYKPNGSNRSNNTIFLISNMTIPVDVKTLFLPNKNQQDFTALKLLLKHTKSDFELWHYLLHHELDEKTSLEYSLAHQNSSIIPLILKELLPKNSAELNDKPEKVFKILYRNNDNNIFRLTIAAIRQNNEVAKYLLNIDSNNIGLFEKSAGTRAANQQHSSIPFAILYWKRYDLASVPICQKFVRNNSYNNLKTDKHVKRLLPTILVIYFLIMSENATNKKEVYHVNKVIMITIACICLIILGYMEYEQKYSIERKYKCFAEYIRISLISSRLNNTNNIVRSKFKEKVIIKIIEYRWTCCWLIFYAFTMAICIVRAIQLIYKDDMNVDGALTSNHDWNIAYCFYFLCSLVLIGKLLFESFIFIGFRKFGYHIVRLKELIPLFASFGILAAVFIIYSAILMYYQYERKADAFEVSLEVLGAIMAQEFPDTEKTKPISRIFFEKVTILLGTYCIINLFIVAIKPIEDEEIVNKIEYQKIRFIYNLDSGTTSIQNDKADSVI